MTPNLTQEQINKLKKIASFEDDKAFAIFQEIEAVNEKLDVIASKETPKMPEMPEIPQPLEEVSINNLPEIQKVEIVNFPKEKETKENKIDLSKTNSLLQQLLDKEAEPLDIKVKLNLV